MKKLILSLVLLPAFYTPLSSAMDRADPADRAAAAAAPPAARPGLSPDHRLLRDEDQAIVGVMTEFCTADATDEDISCILSGLQNCGEAPQARVGRITQTLNTLLNRSNPNDIYQAIRELAGIPINSYDSIVTATTQLVRHGKVNFKISNILKTVKHLPEDSRQDIVEAAATFVGSPLTVTHDITSLLLNFKDYPEDRLTRALEIDLVLPKLLKEDNLQGAGSLIDALVCLPSDRFNSTVNALCQLMRPGIENLRVKMILTILNALPAAKIDDIVKATLQTTKGLYTDNVWAYDHDLPNILVGFVDFDGSLGDRADRITIVLPHLLHLKVPSYAGYIISELAGIPDERFDSIVTAAQELFKHTTSNRGVGGLLSYLKELPEGRMQGIVDGAKVLLWDKMPADALFEALTALNSLDLSNEATLARAQGVANQLNVIRENPEIVLSDEEFQATMIRLLRNPEA